jgi:addiction module HigA family antidote
LLHKFLQPRGITQVRLCEAIEISGPNLNRFIKGGSDVSATLAWKFAQSLGTTPQYWLRLQGEYDLWHDKPRRRARRLPSNGQRQRSSSAR